MKLFIVFFLFFLAIPLGHSRDLSKARLLPKAKPAGPKYPLVLLEVEKQKETIESLTKIKPTLEEATLLPKRVYLYYLESESRWIWVITDAQAKLAEPLEGIRSSTVFPGSYVGAKDPNQKYWLNLEKAVWEKTFQKFQEYYWVYASETDPEKVKVVSYLPATPLVPKAGK